MAARPHDRGRPRARLGEEVAPRARRLAVACSCGLLALGLSRAARADEAQEFELGKNRFEAGQYEEATKRFTTMLDPAVPPCDKAAPKKSGRCRLTDKELIEQARAFAAASLIAQRRLSDADGYIEKLLRANPTYIPNPAIFPAEVSDRFTEVRGRLRAELDAIARKDAESTYAKQAALQKAKEDEQAWLSELQRLAGEERVVEKSSRWLALVPFGVGQFQNGDNGLGLFFAVSEALTGGASIAFAGATSYYQSVDPKTLDENGTEVSTEGLNSALHTSALLNRVAFGVWATLTIAGIVQAQSAFVPERSKMVTRPLPKRPPTLVMPTVAVAPGVVGVGLVGRF